MSGISITDVLMNIIYYQVFLDIVNIRSFYNISAMLLIFCLSKVFHIVKLTYMEKYIWKQKTIHVKQHINAIFMHEHDGVFFAQYFPLKVYTLIPLPLNYKVFEYYS